MNSHQHPNAEESGIGAIGNQVEELDGRTLSSRIDCTEIVEQLTILGFQEQSRVRFPTVYHSGYDPFLLVLGSPYGLTAERDRERRREEQVEPHGEVQASGERNLSR